jgi:arylsulfatase A-like enzyme
MAAKDPPINIILILSDDQGWTDLSGDHLGPYTSGYYETPNLDVLASQGMRFANGYTASPNCSPTRASLLTGRYPATVKLTNVPSARRRKDMRLRAPEVHRDLPPEEVTVAERLRAAGYRTIHLGKWHLGRDDHLPTDQGFDISVTKKDLPERGDWDLHRIDGLTEKAERFIESNADRPFFMYFAHHALHAPIATSPELQAKYDAKPPGKTHINPTYAGMVEHLDWSVGRIMARLEDPDGDGDGSDSIADHTLLVFTSDNGGLEFHGGQVITDNGRLRRGKGTMYEGGIRVPTIFRLPGVIDADSVSDVPISSPDYFPTFLELAGVTDPNSNPLDGESLVPVLTRTGRLQREDLYWHLPHYRGRTKPVGAIRVGDYKLLEFFEDGRLELYNLAVDLGEQADLTAAMPDKVADLHRKLEAWRRKIDAPMPGINPNYGITSGAAMIFDGGDPGDDRQTPWRATIPAKRRGAPTWYLGPDPVNENAPVLAPVSTHHHAFPDKAYDFDGVDDGMSRSSFSVSEDSDSDDSASFEIWFKLDSLHGGNQTLFETGGETRGLSLTIGNGAVGDADGNDDDLRLRVRGGDVAEALTVDLSQYTDPSRNYVQVMAVAQDGGPSSIRLYVNGARCADADLGHSDIDWDGTDSDAGIGNASQKIGGEGGAGTPPFPSGPLQAKVAIFRFYDRALGDAEVLKNYNAALGALDHGISAAEGDVIRPPARPASVAPGAVEDDSRIMVFHERHTSLDGNLEVDILAAGTETTFGFGGTRQSEDERRCHGDAVVRP